MSNRKPLLTLLLGFNLIFPVSKIKIAMLGCISIIIARDCWAYKEWKDNNNEQIKKFTAALEQNNVYYDQVNECANDNDVSVFIDNSIKNPTDSLAIKHLKSGFPQADKITKQSVLDKLKSSTETKEHFRDCYKKNWFLGYVYRQKFYGVLVPTVIAIPLASYYVIFKK